MGEVEITDDFGDYLLKAGRVDKEEYERKQAEARELLGYICSKKAKEIFEDERKHVWEKI